MVSLDEENEEDDDEGKESMLKLFLMVTQVVSNCTPKRRSPTKLVVAPLKDVQVLELWPMVPQCEHFLPIINYSHFNKDYFLTPPPSNQNQTVICMCICESVCVCGRERESRKNGLVWWYIWWWRVRCGVNDNGVTPTEVDWIDIVYCLIFL